MLVTPALQLNPEIFKDPLAFIPWRWKVCDARFLDQTSSLRYFIFLPVWFSTSIFHNLNLSNVYDLCRMKYTQTFCE